MGAVIPSLSSAWADEVGPGCEPISCEPISHGFLREPVSTYSSLAFVVAAVVIVLLGRRRRRSLERAPGRVEAREPSSTAYAVLVAGIGLGSVVQHGPNPFWADLAHDLPLAATLIFIIADSVADLAWRSRVWWWWALPTALLAPVIHFFPQPGDMAQGAVSVVTVLLGSTARIDAPRCAGRSSGRSRCSRPAGSWRSSPAPAGRCATPRPAGGTATPCGMRSWRRVSRRWPPRSGGDRCGTAAPRRAGRGRGFGGDLPRASCMTYRQ